MYTPTKWDTAEQKAKFERQFKKFVSNGFLEKDFPKWFYTRLSMCFGHIAHYDQRGFYNTFFSSLEGKIRFLEITANHGCYGDPAFTYSDVERELRGWVIGEGLIEKYREARRANVETLEREQLTRLSKKYGATA